MNNHILDQLTEKVLSGEMSLERACFKYLTQQSNISEQTVFEYNPSGYTSDGRQTDPDARAMLVTIFEVIQP